MSNLSQKKKHPQNNSQFFFFSEGGRNCREIALRETCDKAPLSYTRGLKWRGRVANRSLTPLRRTSHSRGAAGLLPGGKSVGGRGEAQGAKEGTKGEGKQGEPTKDTRLSSPDSAAAAPREGEDGGDSVGQSARGAGSRPPVTQSRRSACPGRFHSLQSPPPGGRVGGARPV